MRRLVLGKTKNIENSLTGMFFFIFFGFLKFNFVVLTKVVDKRDALALIASPVRFARVQWESL
ncbi:hypothetical protein B0E44_13920 [Flavobacterium sp. A45]|nr:hypothetical protein B0E44_13920 [Flavobacterium sp. A45]